MADGLLRADPSGGELTLRRLRVRRVDPLVFAVQDLAARPSLSSAAGIECDSSQHEPWRYMWPLAPTTHSDTELWRILPSSVTSSEPPPLYSL